jgi:hypothetical protein
MLSPIALGFSIGVVSGICMMAFAWAAWIWGVGGPLVPLYAAIYPGFEASLNGGFYGLGWGLLVGFVFGLLLAIVYNICLCCRSCSCCCCKQARNP